MGKARSASLSRLGTFCSVLQATGLSPHYVELELTEGMLLSNSGTTLSVLHGLKEMGVKLSIDDFGTAIPV